MTISNEKFSLKCLCYTVENSGPLAFNEPQILLGSPIMPVFEYVGLVFNNSELTLIYSCDSDITEGEGAPNLETFLPVPPNWEVPESVNIPVGIMDLLKTIEVQCPEGKKVKGSLSYENRIEHPVIGHKHHKI